MSKKVNCFVSYHHDRDQGYLKEFREKLKDAGGRDFSLKEDLSHFDEQTIYNKVRKKLYMCSVTILLVGERSGYRKWLDWEVWASLRQYRHPGDSKKNFVPNGLIAVKLPVYSPDMPARLQANIDSGYAISMHWNFLERDLGKRIVQAQENRIQKAGQIQNSESRLEENYWNFLGFKM